MEEKQVYVQGDFSFIKNDDLRKLFEKSYQNDNEIKKNNVDMYSWAREKIDEKTDNCWKSFVDTFDEEKLLEEYNKMNNEPITIIDGKINVPIVPFTQSGGKRKSRKSRKSGKKTKKSRKSGKKTKKNLKNKNK